MSARATRPTFRELDLHLVDPPALAVRQGFDEQKLIELADDIKAHGLVQPIGVKRKGDRYEVIFGHRRRVALGMIHALKVPAMIWPDTGVSHEALKIKENKYREDVNPADEAVYLQELLQKECGDDTDTLAALIGEKRTYVEDRLQLLRGDERVLEALRDEKITYTVARELNAIRDPEQRFRYLDAAVHGGATAKLARTWRLEANGFTDRQEAAGVAPQPGPAAAIVAGESPYRCFCCGSDEDVHDLELVYMHRGCRRMTERALRGAAS